MSDCTCTEYRMCAACENAADEIAAQPCKECGHELGYYGRGGRCLTCHQIHKYGEDAAFGYGEQA